MRIDIGTVLNKFDDLVDEAQNKTRTYGIRFFTADGRIREISNARKNVKIPGRSRTGSNNLRSRSMFNLKFNGVMLLFDEDSQNYRSVKVAQMFQFRDPKSKIWLDIFH